MPHNQGAGAIAAAKRASTAAKKGATAVTSSAKRAARAASDSIRSDINRYYFDRSITCPTTRDKGDTTYVSMYMKQKDDGTYEFRTGENEMVFDENARLTDEASAWLRCPMRLSTVSIENPDSPGEYSKLRHAIRDQKKYKRHLDTVFSKCKPIPASVAEGDPIFPLKEEGYKEALFPCRNIFGRNSPFRVTPNKEGCNRLLQKIPTKEGGPSKWKVTKPSSPILCYRKASKPGGKNTEKCDSLDPDSCGKKKTHGTACRTIVYASDAEDRLIAEGKLSSSKKGNSYYPVLGEVGCHIRNSSGAWEPTKNTSDTGGVITGQCRVKKQPNYEVAQACPAPGSKESKTGSNCYHHEFDSGTWLPVSTPERMKSGILPAFMKDNPHLHYQRLWYSQAERDFNDTATQLKCSVDRKSKDPKEIQRIQKLEQALDDARRRITSDPKDVPEGIVLKGNCISKAKQKAMAVLNADIGPLCYRALPGSGRFPSRDSSGSLQAVPRPIGKRKPVADMSHKGKECSPTKNCSFQDVDGTWRRMSDTDYERGRGLLSDGWKWLMGWPNLRDFQMSDSEGKTTGVVKGHCTGIGAKLGSALGITKTVREVDAKKKDAIGETQKRKDALSPASGKQTGTKSKPSSTKSKKKSSSWFSSPSSSSDSGDSIGSSKIKGQLKEAAGILIEVLRSSDNSEQFSSVVERLNKIARGGSVTSIRHALSPIVLDVLHLLHQTPRSHLHKRDVKRLIHQFYQIEKTLV